MASKKTSVGREAMPHARNCSKRARLHAHRRSLTSCARRRVSYSAFASVCDRACHVPDMMRTLFIRVSVPETPPAPPLPQTQLRPMGILLSFIFFTALVGIITYYNTRDEDLRSRQGYFLAGRSLNGWVIAGSLL